MTRITVLGATGFAGGHIAAEAAARGHELTLVSRSTPQDAPAGARVVQGSVLDGDVLAQALDGAEVVVGALSPRGDMEGRVADAYADIAGRLAGTGVRFIIVGGFGSLKDADGRRIVETDAFAPEYKGEARELFAAFERVSATEGVDWTYVSPAGAFGGFIPDQTRRGEYRTGGDTPVLDADGGSSISGADFAIAVVDAIESGEHRGAHVHFAY
ncbi:NAD(P)-dependent oxidoreductase [Agrococcus baldri]|uniref:NAD-dependent dehydratase n=1 Tax=Agrococcus baldri TaxID=153730 RepID=A0AA87US28_9MICO|nr:NAD(P)H-binding protein [Agrococcus baldri]GEK80219.1 NAD-dependent dehydratase [Agrococcus baldri]